MKHIRLFIFFLFLMPVILFAQNNWAEKSYLEFDQNNYRQFEKVNQKIDFDNIDVPLINAAIFFETNKQRVHFNLPPLKYDALLERVAQGHSEDMIEYSFFSHTSVVKGKEQVIDRYKKAGLNVRMSGENLSMRFLLKIGSEPYYPPSSGGSFRNLDGSEVEVHSYASFGEEVVKGWMNSPSHRRSILDPDFEMMGCGSAFYFEGKGIDRVPTMKCTQCFAK